MPFLHSVAHILMEIEVSPMDIRIGDVFSDSRSEWEVIGEPFSRVSRSHARLLLVLCETIVVLRLVAITSNMAFIGYAVAKGLCPVLVLHVVMLPLNCLRLAQLRAVTERPEVETSDRGTVPATGPLIPSADDDKTISGVDADRDVEPRDGTATPHSSARS